MAGLDSQPALAILSIPSEAGIAAGLPHSMGISVGLNSASQTLETATLTSAPPPQPLLRCDCHRSGVGFSIYGILVETFPSFGSEMVNPHRPAHSSAGTCRAPVSSGKWAQGLAGLHSASLSTPSPLLTITNSAHMGPQCGLCLLSTGCCPLNSRCGGCRHYLHCVHREHEQHRSWVICLREHSAWKCCADGADF